MSVFTKEQAAFLAGKLNPADIKTREVGWGDKKQKLSYIEGWRAIEVANEAFGFGGWSSETVILQESSRTLVEVEDKWKKGEVKHQWRVSYIAKVRIDVAGIWREGTGFGSGFAPENDVGAAIEGAIKEAETDARKRALMTFGNRFGLALYDKTQAGVGYNEGEQEAEAFEPKKGGGYKDAKGFTNGAMNSAGKAQTIELLTEDLLDVHTNVQLNDLWKAWAKTINKWTDGEEVEQSWKSLAMEMFTAKRKEINAAQTPLEAG